MPKKTVAYSIIGLIILSIVTSTPFGQEMTREEMINELNELKRRTQKLEQALEITREAEKQRTEEDDNPILHGGERGIKAREADLEKLIEGVELSGAIEVEAVFEKIRPKTEKTEKSSDLALSSVELGIDAEIADRLRVHINLDYEDGERVDVDEAIIHYQADAVCQPNLTCHSPWYASLGKMDIPFGYYESHFISNPLTEALGETKETAILFGMYNQLFNLAGGVFNGDMDETGNDNHIESYFGTVRFTLPEDMLPSFELMSGVSYTSNIADSDDLTEFIRDELEIESIQRTIDGISAFLSLQFDDRYFLEVEFVSALDEFKEDDHLKPRAWNFELAFRPIEVFELAVQYGESDHSLHFLPEAQIGIVGVYEIFENTSLALEYLREIFNNDDEIRTITSQLAIDF